MPRQEEIDPVKVGWLCDWPEAHPFHAEIMQYAYDEAFAKGILDRPIEIVIRTAHGLPRGRVKPVIDAWKELEDEGVLAVYGPQKSEDALQLREYIETTGHIPTVTICGTERFYGEWCFGVTNGALGEEPFLMANYLAAKDLRQVALVVETNRTGRDYLDAYTVAAKREGLETIRLDFVSQVETNFDDLVERLRKTDPQAVVFLGYGYPLVELAAAMERVAWEPVRVANSAILTAASVPGGMATVKGWVGVDQYDEENPVSQQFLDGIEAKEGFRPANGPAMFVYDTCKVIAHGIGLADNLSPAGVRDGLERVKWLPAATGAAGSMLNLGRWQRRAWFGPQYLVLREVHDGPTAMNLPLPSRLVHRFTPNV
jgi:branched-chain amino acid transport system substrate-binding protein